MKVERLFNWGTADIAYIERLLDTLEDYGLSADDVMEDIKDSGLEVDEINNWIYSIMHLLNTKIFSEFEHYVETNDKDPELIDLASEQQDSMSPYTNCVDSHFNNVLDNISFPSSPNEINKKLEKLLK
mgnify:CR=1 FL=1